MAENIEVFSVKLEPGVSNTAKRSSKSPQPASKEFRFVNNSPDSMVKPKSRMKPTFKVETQPLSQFTASSNRDPMMIEQTFSSNTGTGDSGKHGQMNSDRKYVFQLNVKRPPGRPRKHPIEENKVKRPQGRPRKYPIEVSGSSLESAKVLKKRDAVRLIQGQSSTTATQTSHIDNAGLAASPDQFTIPIDTELALASAVRQSRGRPSSSKRSLNDSDGDSDADSESKDQASTVAAAVAVALNEPELTTK